MNLRDLPEGAQRLPNVAKISWAVSGGVLSVFALAIGGGFLALAISTDDDALLGTGIAAMALAVLFAAVRVLLIPALRHKFTFFLVGHDDVMVQTGAFFVKRTVVPFARVQNIETVRGPLDRTLGLTNVNIFTAARPVSISNISAEVGEKIRDEMIAKVNLVRDDLVS